MPTLELTAAPLELPLVHTFTIARSSESVARTVLVRLRWGAIDALGESSPSERYGENVAGVIAGLPARTFGDDPYAFDALLEGLPPAQRCGLDVALHDCIAKDVDRPLWRLLGVDPARAPLTSFTIGIAPLDDMLAKVREVGTHPVIKVKLGAGAGNRNDRGDPVNLRRHDPHRRQRSVESRVGGDVVARTRALRDRILRTADSGRYARAAALDSRTYIDSARDR